MKKKKTGFKNGRLFNQKRDALNIPFAIQKAHAILRSASAIIKTAIASISSVIRFNTVLVGF